MEVSSNIPPVNLKTKFGVEFTKFQFSAPEGLKEAQSLMKFEPYSGNTSKLDGIYSDPRVKEISVENNMSREERVISSLGTIYHTALKAEKEFLDSQLEKAIGRKLEDGESLSNLETDDNIKVGSELRRDIASYEERVRFFQEAQGEFKLSGKLLFTDEDKIAVSKPDSVIAREFLENHSKLRAHFMNEAISSALNDYRDNLSEEQIAELLSVNQDTINDWADSWVEKDIQDFNSGNIVLGRSENSVFLWRVN